MINKLKIENAGQIVMPAGKFLVEQLKERKHTVTRKVPKPVEEQKPTTDEKDPIREMTEVKSREPLYIQFYRVLSAPIGEEEFKVGDIVLASYMAGAPFDLINKTKVLNKYDIIAKYDESNS